MPPDPNPVKMSAYEKNGNADNEIKKTATDCEIRTCQPNDICTQKTIELINTPPIISIEDQKCDDLLIKVPSLSTGRERRNVSSPSSHFHEGVVDPQSPSSSSSASQATSANDATFEPTVEMMVNDFDDEQTLNEEEALASFETQDPDEEINTLKEESEMPLEELLAKYRALPALPPPSPCSEPLRKKPKKSHKEKHRQKCKQETSKHAKANLEFLDVESGDRNNLPGDKIDDAFGEKVNSSKEQKEAENDPIINNDFPKVRRSHLLDLYPEGTFDNVDVVNDSIAGNSKDIPLETIFDVEDEEDEEIEEEEDEDYKKKVMIGSSYQATIPVGLSQYGDILPYENEDKLIWEPCQVSEREVEEYLIKIREIKSNQQGEEDEQPVFEINSETQSMGNGRTEKKIDNHANNAFSANGSTSNVETAATMELDSQAVVKDNEQALHLLVQCGYDFKEALRRKRLNALPLTDCMSLWSEEECHKFEEGIQKYGKDFLKIRQNQVRTRTMRELVQFYYLWKKSERRDHNFANADTVDHMDIYLNEDNEYGSNPGSVLTPVDSPVGNIPSCAGAGRNSNNSQKNISIMTTTSTSPAATNLTSEKNGTNTCLQQHNHQQQQQQHHKRRTHSCNQSVLNVTTTSDFSSENSSNTSNSIK